MPIFISYDNPMLMGDVQSDNIGAATIDAGFRNAQNTFGNLDQQYQASQRQQIGQQGQFVQQDRQQQFLAEQTTQRQAALAEQDRQRQIAEQSQQFQRQNDAVALEQLRQQNRVSLQQGRPTAVRGGTAGRQPQDETDVAIARADKLYGIAGKLFEMGNTAESDRIRAEADRITFGALQKSRGPNLPVGVAAPQDSAPAPQPMNDPYGQELKNWTPPAAGRPTTQPTTQQQSGGGISGAISGAAGILTGGAIGTPPKAAIRFSQAVRGVPTQAASATAISSIAQMNGGRVGVRLPSGQVIDAQIIAINPDNTATVVNNQGQQKVPLSQITAPAQSPPRMPGPGEALVETEDGRQVIINKQTMQEVP